MKTGPDRGIRYREDTGFELKCSYCHDWWPLGFEHWYPRHGLNRCRACWSLYKRLFQAGRMRSDFVREATRQSERARYHADRPKRLEANRRWREANKEHIAAYSKAYRQRNPEAARVAAREYYAEARDVILVKKRQRYADRKAA